jgi:hypothetical protein
MKENGIGLKKKVLKGQQPLANGASLSQDKMQNSKATKNFRVQSKEKNLNSSVNNAKVMEQIDRIKEKKE